MFSHSAHVMTLANSIIGVGILAMPFCFQKCGIILSVVLLILNNWMTRICCHYLIKTSLLTRRRSYEFLGFHAFGSSGKLLVELCIIGYLLGNCITYFVVVGDLGPQIVTQMFTLEKEHEHLRSIIMIAVTIVCILPLGMLKNVDSLAAVCTASIGFYVCLVLKIILESGEHILAHDWPQKVVYWQPSGVLQCLPIFSMASSCQMQLFEVFKSVNNQSMEKLNGIVRDATWICIFVYIAVGFFGYVAFCTQVFAGNILMNFTPSFGSDVIKIGFVLSVAFSFPLVIFPCRASIYSLLYRKGHADATGYIPETRFTAITIFIVAFALGVALMIPSVELVIGLVGSTIGVAICVMFPASCFRKIIKKESTERNLAQFIIVSGFCFMILGTYANLNAIDEKSSGTHIMPPPPPVEENLFKMTEAPVLTVPVPIQKLNEPTLNKLKINENVKNIIERRVQYSQNQKSSKIENDNIDKSKDVVAPLTSSTPAPLPVDEEHAVTMANSNNDNAKKVKEKPNLPLPIVDEKIDANPVRVNNVTMTLSSVAIPSVASIPSTAAPLNNMNINKNATKQQQININMDAIKKDEDVAAEEQKNMNNNNNNNNQAKATQEELKKTQNELKEAKALLERKVDELKEELAKQNKEAQHLVVEKLGEVVEKVEQIERKVQQKEQDAVPSVATAPAAAAPVNKEPIEPQRKQKNSLMSILSEGGHIKDEVKTMEKVYEPLSYKTGELIEHARSGNGKLEQRLPLPLALLINASQVKMANENSIQAAPKNQDRVQDEKSIISKTIDKESKNKENVESIRRDILQVRSNELNNNKDTIPDIPLIPTNNSGSLRIKRSIDLATTNVNIMNTNVNNCLNEPKVETLLAPDLNSLIDFNLQNIGGRSLKALNEKQPK